MTAKAEAERIVKAIMRPIEENGLSSWERLVLVFIVLSRFDKCGRCVRARMIGSAADISASLSMPTAKTNCVLETLKTKGVLHEHENGGRRWWRISVAAITRGRKG